MNTSLLADNAVAAGAVMPTDCVAAQCTSCGENFPDDDYAYHFDTNAEMISAIAEADWHLGAHELRCTNCQPDDQPTPGALAALGTRRPDCLNEVSCFTIRCTRCTFILETDCGQAHFPSAQAAAEAAVSARWTVSPHQVWCRTCTAAVSPSPPTERITR